MAGCEMEDNPKRGGQVPICDEYGETSIKGIFVAGDVSGIEEASSAMIEGRIAGIAAAHYLGYMDEEELKTKVKEQEDALDGLRQGMFAPKNRGKLIEKTEEGIDISMNLLKKGYVADDEIERFPGVTHKVGVHPVMECTQNIPCNPCQDACPKHCIRIGENITSLPVVDPDVDMLRAENVSIICSQNVDAGYMATKYLLDKGHTCIAHLCGDDRLSSRDRIIGYKKAMIEAGLEEKDLIIEPGDFNSQKAYIAAEKILDTTKATAIYASNDAMAISAIRAAEARGLRVPEDISIMGCDYSATYAELGYNLTSIEISLHDIARAALRSVVGIDAKRKLKCPAILIKGTTA
jgi:hypothetical protein